VNEVPAPGLCALLCGMAARAAIDEGGNTMSRLQRSMLAAVSAASVVLLAACGSSSSTTAGSTPPAASSPGSASSSVTPSDTGSPAPSGSCGTGEIDGVTVRTFCGTGTVTVITGGGSFTLTTAECTATPTGITVNAGTIVLGRDDKAKALEKTTQYVGIIVGSQPDQGFTGAEAPKDGTYKDGVITGQNKGESFSSNAKGGVFVLAQDRTLGTGKATGITGGPVSATWKCT
jgi:hypothetical protein